VNRVGAAAGIALMVGLGAGAAAPVAAAVGPDAPRAHELRLVLPLRFDRAGLERFALAVTTPGSQQYGRYLSIASLARRFGPSAAVRRRVVRFLRAQGARDVSVARTGVFAAATLPRVVAGRLFATSRRATAAGGTPRLPRALRGLVTGVVGFDSRPLAAPNPPRPVAHAAAASSSVQPRSGTPSGCFEGQATDAFTPNQYLTAYDFNPLRLAGVEGQGERVALIEIDGYKSADIRTFAKCFGLSVPPIEPFGVGISRPLGAGGEATLDLEALDAAAPKLKAVDVYETSPDAADTLEAMTAPLENRGHLPQIVSVSLGLCEADVVGALSPRGIDAAEITLAIAAATGITYLAASGDQGSADCTDQNDNPVHQLAVNYPASSWWVTAVGGTNFSLDGTNQIVSQLVWNDAGDEPGSAGGGGLSVGFHRPNYQKGTVPVDHRAVPDVSMLADIAPGYAVYCTAVSDCGHQPWTAVGGTSGATPLLAGGLALVDQQLREAGRAQLGLANPLLYALGRSNERASAFDDVTEGDNDVFPFVGGRPALGCCDARSGFDYASGWGSVRIAGLARAALSQQPRIVRATLSLPGAQHPLGARRIRAVISCSAACVLAAYARVRIGRSEAFEVDSAVSKLAARGRATISLRFSSHQLGRLRTARGHHDAISATVYGVILDPAVYGVVHFAPESVAQQTSGKRLAIS
jgi:kumamolisin